MRKNLSLLLAAILICSISGCGTTSESVTTDYATNASSENSVSSETAEISETTETSDTEVAEPVAETVSYPMIDAVIGCFSENRAWISYYAWVQESPNELTKEPQYGLIDETGHLLYHWDRALYGTTGLSNDRVVDFDGGIGCITGYFYNNQGEEYELLIVVDAEGNEIFNSTAHTGEADYYYICSGGGIVLVAEHTLGFSESTWNICEIDASGSIVSRTDVSWFEEDFFTAHDLCGTYYGDNIFGLHIDDLRISARRKVSFVYNTGTHQLFHAPFAGLFGDFYDGISALEYVEGEVDNLFIANEGAKRITVTPDCLTNEQTFLQYAKEQPAQNTDWFDQVHSCWYSEFEDKANYSEGLFYCSNGYYDYNSEKIITLPEDWDVLYASNFSGGYAVLSMKGADGNGYVTVIDRSGNTMYDPIRVDSLAYSVPSSFGYIRVTVNSEEVLLTPEGNIYAQVTDDQREYLSPIKGGYIPEYSEERDNSGFSFVTYHNLNNDAKTLTEVWVEKAFAETFGTLH